MPLPAILGIAGAASSLFNTINSIGASRKMKREAAAINPVWNFKQSDDAAEMKGFAQSRLNSRNPFSEANRRGVQASQANMNAAAQRNALDPSQALLLAAAGQGQADQSMFNMGQQDLAWQQQNQANYMNALQTGVNQDNIENQFMAQKFQIDQGRKDALMSAARQSTSNALSNLGSTLFTSALGAQQGMFNFGKAATPTTGYNPVMQQSLVRFGTQGIQAPGMINRTLTIPTDGRFTPRVD